MRKFASILLFALLLIMAVVPTLAQDDMSTIADIVVSSAGAEEPEFTVLLTAVSAADPSVLEALSDPEAELTVFAPTDEAFTTLIEAIGEDAFADIVADTEALTEILLYHVVSGAVMAEDVVALEDGTDVLTLLEEANITVSFGEDEDGNAIVMVNDATVIVTDIEASNGVIHVIDTVLLPPSDDEMMDDDMMDDMGTIADIVVSSAGSDMPEFTILLTAVSAADPAVLEALSDPEAELTVFAPTDEAFAALIEAIGEDTFGDIVADTETLTNILLYHVVSGVVMAEDVVTLEDGTEVPTLLEGANITVTFGEDEDGNATVMVNDATVIVTDIEASNGVIHVIDTVLLPPSDE